VNFWEILLAGTIGYGLGSIPFAILVTYWRVGFDVRTIGSGHAGATNAMRAAGWGPGLLVAVLDLGKGFVAVWLTQKLGNSPLTPAIAAGAAVIGHCWPLYAGFRGGMGVASGAGGLLAIWPLGFVLAVGLGAFLQLIVRHSARANFLTGILLTPLWALFGANWSWLVATGFVGVVISLRALSDWRRIYKELWWDRDIH
jgi:glycerol-3-phosphate acyltransferase PlsY